MKPYVGRRRYVWVLPLLACVRLWDEAEAESR